MATLRPGEEIYYSVIDVWSALMNEKETYKAAESPSRLFFNIGLSVNVLILWLIYIIQYQTTKLV